MPRIWKIKKFDGLDVVEEWSASSSLSEPEICTMLQRLVSRTLSDKEIIDASLRRNHRGYRPHLERVGIGNPISFGAGTHYTAELEDN